MVGVMVIETPSSGGVTCPVMKTPGRPSNSATRPGQPSPTIQASRGLDKWQCGIIAGDFHFT